MEEKSMTKVLAVPGSKEAQRNVDLTAPSQTVRCLLQLLASRKDKG